jgi:hypothetical protein
MAVKQVASVAAALVLGVLSLPVMGQATPGGNGQQPGTTGQLGQPGGNNGRQRRQYDPAQVRQQMMDRMKQALGATDEEFAAISPKLQQVMDLSRDASGRGGRMRIRGGQNGQNGQPTQATPSAQPLSPVRQAAADLRAVTQNKDSKPEEIKAKLDAYRQAKAQAKVQLAAAQQELKGLLTQRQEATLVEMGLLD